MASIEASIGKGDSLDRHHRLVTHLLDLHEAERIAVASQLHDDMGSFLVSAVMDLAWAETHLGTDIKTLSERLQRIRANLRSAIDLKRSMTEHLRPTLLDNFGLFAACRWHLKHVHTDSPITRTESYPADELPLTSEALTGLFRIVEGLLDVTARTPQIAAIDLTIMTDEVALQISVAHEYARSEVIDASEFDREKLATVLHRVRALQGEFESTLWNRGGRYRVSASLQSILTKCEVSS